MFEGPLEPWWEGLPSKPYDYVGFVYEIENHEGKKYIGQKKFWKKVTYPPLKGRKNKRHKEVLSDFLTYWGSNTKLQEDVLRANGRGFKRRILRLCKGKVEMNYFEALYQFQNDVLGIENKNNKDKYYNNMINVRIGGKQV